MIWSRPESTSSILDFRSTRSNSKRSMLAATNYMLANKGITMNMTLASVLARLHEDERGQGLVEYMLIVLLVAFGATAGMSSLASYMNIAFSNIGLLLNQYIP